MKDPACTPMQYLINALLLVAGLAWPSAALAQAPVEPLQTETSETVPLTSTEEPLASVEAPKGEHKFAFGVMWESSFPIGSSRDFVRKFDPAGLSASARLRRIVSLPSSRLGLIFELAWHNMEEKTDSSLTRDNLTLTGTQIRELAVSPLVAKPYFALGDLGEVSPYLGLGLGLAYAVQRLDIGIYRDVTDSWQFVVQPELGVEVPFGPVLGLAAVKLNYLAKSERGDEQMYLNFCLGLGFY